MELPLRPQDIDMIRTPGSLTLSPDGTQIAYQVTSIDGDAYVSRILIGPTDLTAAAVVLSDGPRDAAPVWQPGGDLIAFLRAPPGGAYQLHILPASGGGAQAMTDLPLGIGAPVTARHARGIAAPVWSPDGRRLAFTARVSLPRPGRARRITRLRYRIDGSGYVHDCPSQVFVLDLDGGQTRQLSDGAFDHWDVSWHPDGDHIVAATARHPERDLDEANDIAVFGLDGSTRLVGKRSTTVNLPTVSPDGKTLLFVGIGDLAEDPNDARARNVGLWSIPFAGGIPHRLTDAETIDLDDGRTRPLVFVDDGVLAGRLHRGAVHLVSIGETGVCREVIGGARQVSDYAAAGGVVAACVCDAKSAGEVVVVKAGTEHVLSDLGAGLTGTGLHSLEEIAAAAPDGYPVHGWLVKPPGAGPHPLLLLVHGGPDVQVGHQFFDEAQVYASAGFAVILSNPRGSAGYGEAHARAIRGRLGSVDADDLIALLDAVTVRPEIDAGRVGVLGGSYGGFMTAWLAAHHGERFKAALGERGVYAMESMFGASDITVATASMIGSDRTTWAAQTPLAVADRIEIPFLIMHWEGDLRVPFDQAQQFFTALRSRRRETEFVAFPGGTHNASRNGMPAERVERFEIILDWFRRYLFQAN